MSFAHTPYDGSRRPFTIGLTPLDVADWIEPDAHLARDLAEKDALIAQRREVVFRETPGSRPAQRELRDLLVNHLASRFPALYAREADAVRVAGQSVALESDAPIIAAARLVQEDLCILTRGPQDWSLAAAVVCFPSGWSLAEKIGRGLGGIHAPVPGYEGRMNEVVARIIDRLRPDEPVVRFNWSIHADGVLHHPATEAWGEERFTRPQDIDGAQIRIERQTLRVLPRTGAVAFTIRTYTDPISDLAHHPQGRSLAAGLLDQLQALTPEQAAYKGLAAGRDGLAAALARIAAGG